MAASILLARYLKKKYPAKNIVFGGLRYFAPYFAKRISDLNFVNSLVIGLGENSTRKIINSLINNQPLNKIYKMSGDDIEVPVKLDYSSFRNLDFFRFNRNDLENIYNIKIDRSDSNQKEILFIPYKFTIGCFWAKCRYCGQSGQKPHFKTKNIKEIVNDLLELKELCDTNYFIFYNNNFNSNLDFTRKLLKAIIASKLNILWTDSFNLVVLDDEIIELLQQAGCIRMDIGISTLDKETQQFYKNILHNNKLLQRLKKIYKSGIWVDTNIIANLPKSFATKKEIEILGDYIQYIDGATLNSYRAYHSDILINFKKYKLSIVNQYAKIFKRSTPMLFMENDFCGSPDDRKKTFGQDYVTWHNFLKNHKILVNFKFIYLLGYLYRIYGHKNKTLIKEYMLKASQSAFQGMDTYSSYDN